MAITPSSVTLEPSATQQFSQIGIASPVRWGVDGIGSINQSGLYAAPNGGGAATIRVFSSIWGTVPSGYTVNSDDTVTLNGTQTGATQLVPSLAGIGDYVEYIAQANVTASFYLKDATGNYAWWDASQVFITPYTLDSGSAGTHAVGDVLRLERTSATQVVAKKNGAVVWTFTVSYSGNLSVWFYSYSSNAGTIRMRVGGSTVINYTEANASVLVMLPILLPRTNLELYCEPHLLTLSNGANVLSLTDQSAHLRHLTAASSYPTFQTNVVNGKSVVRFNGSQNPLKNTANFTVSCGWIVANFNGATFSDYKGLLSDLVNQTILVSNNSGTNFFDTQIEFFEFRSNDRIYPATDAPAPMNAFKLIFFRFWKPIVIDGIQLGQQTTFSARKWNGDVAFLALYSGGFCESDIRKYSKILADNFALTLADVFPYQADKSSPQSSAQSINFYDPPEGERISEVIGEARENFDLNFTSRRLAEVKAMRDYHRSHYAQALPFIYRNYKFLPPEDVEGYFDSPYEISGGGGSVFSYGFRFRGK